MSGLSLVARIKELAYLHDGGHAYKLESVLADVRELQEAALELKCAVFRSGANIRLGRIRAILTKCAGSAKEPTNGS